MTDAPPRAGSWRGRLTALVGIVLFAFSLRSAVASLSPLLADVQRDMTLEPWVVGLIGTAPPVSFAVAGLVAPAIERRLGLHRVAVVALGVIALALALRAAAPDAVLLVAATVVIFAAVGVGNVVLPPLVKQSFPDRIGTLTAVYTTTMAVATFLPALVAVPVADASHWRASLGLWALFALAGVVPWVRMLWLHRSRSDDAPLDEARPSVLGRVVRTRLAWALAVTFATSSAIAYSSFAWLPTIVADLTGASAAASGALLALFGAMGLPASIVVPLIVVRHGRVRTLYAVAVLSALAGIAGLVVAPALAPWLWVALLGTGPLLFPMVLVLLGLRTRTHETAIALSGFVQSAGYAIAALVPLAMGVVHDLTGGWTASLMILIGLLVCASVAGLVVARPGDVEDAWRGRG